MSNAVLKAIKDWCNGKFQAKGDYLTKVPEKYITDVELNNAMKEMVTTEKLDNQYLGGIRLGKDESGNPGYYKYDEEAGADTLVPFSKGGGGSGEFYYPFCPVGYAITATSYQRRLSIRNNNNEFQKIKIKGEVIIRATSTTAASRNITPGFSYYTKNADGSRGAMKTINLCDPLYTSGITDSHKSFEKEISLENVWFSNANDSYYCGVDAVLNSTGSCEASLRVTEIIFYK